MSRDLNGTTDFISADGLVSKLAGDTIGTIAGWVNCDADNNTYDTITSAERDADSTLTLLNFWYDFGASKDYIEGICYVDGTAQWRCASPIDSTDALIGTWAHVAIVQDGVSPLIYINGVAQVTSFSVSTDKTKWFKAVFTDATSKADNFNFGMIERNATNIQPMNGKLRNFGIWNVVPDAPQIKALAQGRSPAFYPHGLQANFPLNGRSSPEPELVSGNVGTLTGTSYSASEPRIIEPYEPRRIFVPAAVGGGGAVWENLDSMKERKVTRGIMRGVGRGIS